MGSSHCFVIGLTGGIASGKTTVSNIFKDLGCQIIDADVVAREVVKPNSYGLNQLIKLFGKEIVNVNNQLDRNKLRILVFNNQKKLSLLNSILHPLIHENIMNQIKNVTKSYCIIVIPLLCESDRYDWLDRILIVDVSKETQFKRLMKRDAITHDLATKMIQSQCSRNVRLEIADDVINNEQSLVQLQKQVKNLNSLYKSF